MRRGGHAVSSSVSSTAYVKTEGRSCDDPDHNHHVDDRDDSKLLCDSRPGVIPATTDHEKVILEATAPDPFKINIHGEIELQTVGGGRLRVSSLT
jgi:hypothetical protein